jgi:hypothetical protein
MRKAALLIVAALAACAPLPKDIEPATVSASKYAAYTCEQIVTDIRLFEPKLLELAIDQTEQRQFDSGAALIVGVTPRMMGAGEQRDTAISQLRGDLTALRSEGEQKGCALPPETPRLQKALEGKVWRTPAEKAAKAAS